MRLAQLRGSSDVTVADLAIRPGDVPYKRAEYGVDVIWRGVGDGYRLLWRDHNGRLNAKDYRVGAEAIDAVERLQRFGVLPWRPSTSKTLRHLIAIGA